MIISSRIRAICCLSFFEITYVASVSWLIGWNRRPDSVSLTCFWIGSQVAKWLRRRGSGCRRSSAGSKTRWEPSGRSGGSEKAIATASTASAAKTPPAVTCPQKGQWQIIKKLQYNYYSMSFWYELSFGNYLVTKICNPVLFFYMTPMDN